MARIFASVLPRQSPSSMIFCSMNAEADSMGGVLSWYSSTSSLNSPTILAAVGVICSLREHRHSAGWQPINEPPGLSGDVHNVTDLGQRMKLDCPHTMGTNAFSPQRAESFRHFLLLSSPSAVYHGCQPTNLRVSFGAGAAQLQTLHLRIVVMPDHVHLLLSEPQHDGGPLKPAFGLNRNVDWLSKMQSDTLADALKSLKQGVSRRLIGSLILKPKAGLMWPHKHFWQKRYYDFNIRNYPQFVEKLRYIHRNPVKAWIVRASGGLGVEQFSSLRNRREGRVGIESECTARKRERAAGKLCPAVELLPESARQS